MVKQYTTEVAYIGNTRINRYCDGKLSWYDIVADYELPTYQRMLENEGYVFCYDLAQVYGEFKIIEVKYRYALEELKTAREHHIYGQNELDICNTLGLEPIKEGRF